MLTFQGLFAACLIAWSSPPAPNAPTDSEGPATAVADRSAERQGLEARAEQVRALTAGTLAPSVDADSLFIFDATDPAWGVGTSRWLTLLAAIREPEPAPDKKPPRAVKPRPGADMAPAPASDPADTLVAAYAEFFSHPREWQIKRLEEHRQQRAAQQQALVELRARTGRLNALSEEIEVFLAHTAERPVDPHRLLTRDLLAESAIERDGRPRSVDKNSEAHPDHEDSSELAQARQELQAAQARYDDAWLALAGLTPAQRDALTEPPVLEEPPAGPPVSMPLDASEDPALAASAKAINAADERAALAADEREQAEVLAKAARSESLRVLAEERVTLLSIKEAQAKFAGDLERLRAQGKALHEMTLEWQRRVALLADGRGETAADADAMYEPLRERLAAARELLRGLLATLGTLGEGVPDPRTAPRAPTDVDRDEIDRIRLELTAEAEALRVQESKTTWEAAKSVRDDTVALNRARLTLLELASPRLRQSVTGMTDSGLDQVRRELDQIVLELRYHARAWPRTVAAKWLSVRSRPLALTLGLLQAIVLLGVFLVWRRSADGVLARMRADLLERGIDASVPTFRSTLLYYLRRIRSPLEWLLLLLIGTWLIGGMQDFPEVELLWLAAEWGLVGWTIVLLLDAVAARQSIGHPQATDTSLLRLESLRLVGYTVVAVGLMLSWTKEIVGVGAIHNWVLRLCWFLLIPMALRLVQRWRPVIFERIDARGGRDAFVRWVAAHRKGWLSFVSGFVGGVYLFGNGLARYVSRLLQGAEVTRRLLAYSFRRSATRMARNEEVAVVPLAEELRDALHPDRTTAVELGFAEPIEAEIVDLLRHGQGVMVAVVGERGMGKSTFLRRLARRFPAEEVLVLECPPGPPEAVLDALARALGCCSGPAEILAALRDGDVRRVLLDDVQRVIRPTIGGLAAFDTLAELARAAPFIDWVLGIGAPVWQYISRARSDRMIFDRVVTLGRWSDDQIGALMRARSAEISTTPSFARLAAGGVEGRTTLPEDLERAERGFYRMLWDLADGNPGVALEIWRNSLFVGEGSDAHTAEVRYFQEPAASDIERLPQTALFVLRAIVQLERAATEDIVECTRLSQAEVQECVSFCLARGYAEMLDGRVRISWAWFRTITRVLARQHLLAW